MVEFAQTWMKQTSPYTYVSLGENKKKQKSGTVGSSYWLSLLTETALYLQPVKKGTGSAVGAS